MHRRVLLAGAALLPLVGCAQVTVNAELGTILTKLLAFAQKYAGADPRIAAAVDAIKAVQVGIAKGDWKAALAAALPIIEAGLQLAAPLVPGVGPVVLLAVNALIGALQTILGGGTVNLAPTFSTAPGSLDGPMPLDQALAVIDAASK